MAKLGLSTLEAGLLGTNALSGLFGGLLGSGAQKAATKEQKREFDISNAMAPTRALEGLPLRDRLLHILMSRFGNAPNTYAQAQQAYTPGAGGTAGSKSVYEEMLRRMGYGAKPGIFAGLKGSQHG